MHKHINRIFPETNLMQPKSLNAGGLYLFQARDVDGVRSHARIVKFHKYDACPAFAIIEKSDGSRKRCLREDLFGLRDRDHINSYQQLSSSYHRQIREIEVNQDKRSRQKFPGRELF